MKAGFLFTLGVFAALGLLVVLGSVALCGGCAAVAVGTGAGAASVINSEADRITASQQAEKEPGQPAAFTESPAEPLQPQAADMPEQQRLAPYPLMRSE